MMSAICLAFIIFLLKSLFVTNKVVSLQCISNGVGMGHKSPVPPRGRFSAALFYFLQHFLISKVEVDFAFHLTANLIDGIVVFLFMRRKLEHYRFSSLPC